MIVASLLALNLAGPAHAGEYDPEVVLAVGARAAGSGALVAEGWLGADAMVQGSVEVRFDKRTSGRLEVGGNPIRGRVHIAGAGRAYPAGRGRSAWWAEVSGHVQRTGPRVDPDHWAPRPARAWVSLPFLAGAGWRVFASESLVVDLGVHGGPMIEFRPREPWPLGFGFVATGHVLVGTAF